MGRKLVSMLLAVGMLLGLAACNGETQEIPSAQESQGETSQSAAESGEPVTIKFWNMQIGGDKYPEMGAELAARITEDLPNIVIEYQSIPWANYRETFSTAIAAGEGPDFSEGSGYQSFQYAAAGEILDVSSIIDEWEADGTLDNYDPSIIEYFQYDGMQVGIPWNYEPRYLIYRADWFERDGIEVPTTWDELYEAAVHFTDKENGVYGFAFPASGSPGNVIFNLWFSMNGTGYWKEDGSMPDFTNEKNLESLNFLTKMQNAGVFPEGMAAYEMTEVVQLAVQDKLAMCGMIMGSNAAPIKDAGMDDVWKVMPVPAGPSADGNEGYVAAINAIMAYSQTEHPEETKAAMKWWCEHMQEMWNNPDAAISGMPVREDWLTDEFIENNADPFMRDYIDLCYDTTHLLIYPAKTIDGWLTQNVIDGERWTCPLAQSVLLGEKSNEELLQELQDKAMQTMIDFGEYQE